MHGSLDWKTSVTGRTDGAANMKRKRRSPRPGNRLPLQPGDVPGTLADNSERQRAVGYRPNTTVKKGGAKFVAAYREFYGI